MSSNVKKKIQNLKSLALESKLKTKQWLPFLAAVQIDIERTEPIGLAKLFELSCKFGKPYWLNPISEFKVLEDILLKYRGSLSILKPFVEILINLAENNIPPFFFIQHIMMPRMAIDNNWRKWYDRHFDELFAICNFLITIRQETPFDQDVLGNQLIKMITDVVVVKYIGKVLYKYPKNILTDSGLIDKYKNAWTLIQFKNTHFINFFRLNIQPVFVALSGKIGIERLCSIINSLSNIEKRYEEFYSHYLSNSSEIKISKDILFYGNHVGMAINKRYKNKYSAYEIAYELDLYLKILEHVLQTNSGIHLSKFYTKRLSKFLDLRLTELLKRLVLALNTQESMYFYKWHTIKFFNLKPSSQEEYVEYIEDNGYDADYPFPTRIFREYDSFENNLVPKKISKILGISEELLKDELRKSNQRLSAKFVIEKYTQKLPGVKEIVNSFQDDFINGKDRHWNNDIIDKLNNITSEIHPFLLKSIIKGYSVGQFSFDNKESILVDLYNNYKKANKLDSFEKRFDFNFPKQDIVSVNRLMMIESKKKINTKLISKIWDSISDYEKYNTTFNSIINNEIIKLNKAITNKMNKIPNLDVNIGNSNFLDILNDFEKTNNDSSNKKANIGIIKSLRVMINKLKNLENVTNNYNLFNDIQKLIIEVIVLGDIGKNGDELTKHAISSLIKKYIDNSQIKQRLNFLEEDIIIDNLTFEQLGFIINTIEVLNNLFIEDKDVVKIFESIEEINKSNENRIKMSKIKDFGKILKPYIQIRNQQLSIEALDSAFKKSTSLTTLEKIKSDWKDILLNISKKGKKYFTPYAIIESKSFLDSHYGHMGGICLSEVPYMVLDNDFLINRIIDYTAKQSIGMFITLKQKTSQVEINNKIQYNWEHWLAFAFNPLGSILCNLSSNQQLYLYLKIRNYIEQLSMKTNLPIVLTGVTTFGVTSNNGGFSNLIINFEDKYGGVFFKNNTKLNLVYSEEVYADCLLIIDPKDKNTFKSNHFLSILEKD